MLDKQKILTFAVIFSILGISCLYIFSAQSSNRKMDLTKIDENLLGSHVRTEGVISDISWFSYMVLFDIKEEGEEESLTVVCDRDIIEDDEKRNKLVPGTKVTVEGELEEYEGEMNLRIDPGGELIIKERALSSFTPLSELLANPKWYEDMKIKVKGEIIEIDNTSQTTTVILTDLESARYELQGEIVADLYNGEKNIVGYPAVLEGYMRYENYTGTWKLRCTDSFEVNSEEVY
ncbi:MAG: hypothetical protein ACOC87_01790 [Candidatus Natronoplasma sp.]